MNNRIKTLRKYLNKTQEEFGVLCGKSRRAIAAYEQGAATPDESFIQLLSLKFKVNINWLKTGKEEMFINDEENLINEISSRYNLDNSGKQFLTNFLELDQNERKIMLQCMSFMLNNKSDDEKTYNEKMQEVSTELLAEEQGKTSTVSTISNIQKEEKEA